MIISRPLISIITPCYNAEATIAGTIESVIDQSFDHLEHIIVDGGSVDKTLEIVEGFRDPRIKCLKGPDRGGYDAMNKGVEQADGQWLIFIGADDCLYSRHTLGNIFSCNFFNCDYIYGDVEYDTGEVFRSTSGKKMLFKNSIHHQSVFYNRRVFECFRYDVEKRLLADFELNLKLYINGIKSVRVDEIICKCAEGGLSRRADFIGYDEEIRVRKKYFSRGLFLTLLNIQTLLRFFAKKTITLINNAVDGSL